MYTYDREEGVGEFLICIYRIKVEEQEPWEGFEPMYNLLHGPVILEKKQTA